VAFRAAVLAIAVVLVFLIVAPLIAYLGGPASLVAAAVAAGVCLAGAAFGLVADGFRRDPADVVRPLLLSMAARMGLPLACGLAVQLRGGPLAEAGFLYYLVVFYLITLAVATTQTLSERRSDAPSAATPANPIP
jgi:hypothetical protein